MIDNLILLFDSGIIYIFIFCLLFLSAIKDFSKGGNSDKKPRLMLGCIILFLFLSLRWKTGCDWGPYYELFNEVGRFDKLKDIYHFDYGYLLENYIVKIFTNSYTALLLVNSSIIFVFLYRILIRESNYPNLSLFLFYCIYFPIHFMGGNRRAVAIIFALFFIFAVYNKRYKKGIVALVIAAFFHKSALISIISIFIPHSALKRKVIVIIILVSLFIGATGFITGLFNSLGNILGVGPVMDMLTFYSNEGEGAEYANEIHPFASTMVGFTKRCLVLFYVYLAQKHMRLTSKDYYLINLYLFSIIIYMAFAEAGVLQVMSIYYAIFDIFLFSRFLQGFSSQKKTLMVSVFLAYGLLQLINNLSVYPKLYIPYNSVLFI